MYDSKPKTRTGLDETLKGFSGQDNPREALQKDINPPAHGFNKAHDKGKFQSGSNDIGGAKPGNMKGG